MGSAEVIDRAKGGRVSVKVMARVWSYSQRKDGELLVMLALADFANDAGESWPSIPVLAAKARLTERQTRRVLIKLEEASEIRRIKSNGGRNRRNHYFITVIENPDIVTGKELQGKNNSVIGDTKTLTPMSGALNHHRTVNKSASRKKRERADTDPRVKTLLTAFADKYRARVGSPYPVTQGKDAALLQGLLAADYDVPAIEAVMDRYFANDFYGSKAGFDVGGFKSAFSRLNSAGAKKRHNYDGGAFPAL
jgi:hypothetical protein